MAMSPGTVQCTLPGCNQAMTPGQLDRHLDTCDMREAQCRHCDTRLPFRHLSHESFACRRAPVVCPFNCNDHTMPRYVFRIFGVYNWYIN